MNRDKVGKERKGRRIRRKRREAIRGENSTVCNSFNSSLQLLT